MTNLLRERILPAIAAAVVFSLTVWGAFAFADLPPNQPVFPSSTFTPDVPPAATPLAIERP